MKPIFIKIDKTIINLNAISRIVPFEKGRISEKEYKIYLNDTDGLYISIETYEKIINLVELHNLK